MRQFTSKADKDQLSVALLPTISLLAVFLLVLAGFFLRPEAVKADDTTYIRYGVGYYDAFDSYDATEFHIELLPGYHILDVVRPFTGVMATSDSATYGYAGLRAEFDLAPQWQIVPAFAAGGYSDGTARTLVMLSSFGVHLRSITSLTQAGALADRSIICPMPDLMSKTRGPRSLPSITRTRYKR